MKTDGWCCGMVTLRGTALSLSAVIMLAASSATAQTGSSTNNAASVGFTTYLRTGPSVRYPVLDEVLSNERIEVLACADGWCRIQYGSGVGYVSQAALDGPRATLPTEGAQSCFVQPIAGYHGGPDVRFCTSAPAH